MPNRRDAYADRISDLGLPAPDEQTMHLLWQIVDEGVLGASNHVHLAFELLSHLLSSIKDNQEQAWACADCAARFICETRGVEAPVVGNAVRSVLAGLDGHAPDTRLSELQRRIEEWNNQARQRQRHLVQTATQFIGAGRTVIAFDYSSTVAAIVTALARVAAPERVVVPESRAIAGGRRYVEAFAAAGIDVHYVVDAAFEYVLQDNAVVLLGAESLRCDGSLLNTIGSRPLARLACWRGCPVYGCADLLKLDTRSYLGLLNEPSARSFDHLIEGLALPEGAVVTTEAPELEVVPASLITALLTDEGPVPPAAVWQLGRRFLGDSARRGKA